MTRTRSRLWRAVGAVLVALLVAAPALACINNPGGRDPDYPATDEKGADTGQAYTTISISLSGTPPPYMGFGLANGTPIAVDPKTGVAKASASAPRSGPMGIQQEKGSDTYTFEGTYEDGVLEGQVEMTTRSTATGGSATATHVSYTFEGGLRATVKDGQLSGGLTGDTELKQTWDDKRPAHEKQDVVQWLVKGTATE